ncbi:facilitated trehalose transporter Tret1-like isoform X2 [Leguminivora glycinivorella]|uniref:facilitated trehalose transporter Tret1-like isoform X2 n=1 Tax=Leguminivora glycinivorella TaxID=1035111 RepID=UPI00200C99CD|nr:facilitated trehalose transporter Tret1-like isoform X2 [Leguminivora glycinivorella]
MQWISGVVANSTLFTYGLQAGWLSPSAKVLQSSSSPTGAPLTDNTLGWVASLMPITAACTVPLFSILADRIGRKKSILLMTVPQFGCWLLKLFATNLTYLIIARICYGLAAAGCFSAVPIYNKEIAQDSIRGRMGSMLIFFLNLGILTIYALGAYLDYYTVLYVVSGIPVLTFFCMLKCPESPGYLVKVGRYDEAAESLSCLRCLPAEDLSLQGELEYMKKQDEYYKTLPNLSLIVIFKNKAWRKAYLISTLLIAVQALSGNFALVTYGANIVSSVADMNAELQTLSFPTIMMLGSVVSVCVTERVARKKILLFSYVVSVLSLGTLATVMLLPKDTVLGWLMLLAITASMFVYAVGVLPGPYIIMAEVFNIQIRAKLMGVVTSQAWLMCFTQLATFAPISAVLGMYTYFYICAAMNLLGVIVVLVLLPETRGKSIEEVELELAK